jgi:hypothetical protein
MGRHQSINSLVNSMTRLDVARLDLLLAGHERLTFAVLRLPISAPSREIIKRNVAPDEVRALRPYQKGFSGRVEPEPKAYVRLIIDYH